MDRRRRGVVFGALALVALAALAALMAGGRDARPSAHESRASEAGATAPAIAGPGSELRQPAAAADAGAAPRASVEALTVRGVVVDAGGAGVPGAAIEVARA